MMMTIPRSEYPRPQFERDAWQCLNGEWQFEIDQGDTGKERGLPDKELSGRGNWADTVLNKLSETSTETIEADADAPFPLESPASASWGITGGPRLAGARSVILGETQAFTCWELVDDLYGSGDTRSCTVEYVMPGVGAIVSADVAFGSKAAFIRCSLHPRKLTSPSTARTSKVRCSEKTLTHADHHTTGERPPSTLIAVPVM